MHGLENTVTLDSLPVSVAASLFIDEFRFRTGVARQATDKNTSGDLALLNFAQAQSYENSFLYSGNRICSSGKGLPMLSCSDRPITTAPLR